MDRTATLVTIFFARAGSAARSGFTSSFSGSVGSTAVPAVGGAVAPTTAAFSLRS